MKRIRTINEIFRPFVAGFYNAFFPGAGFWYIGQWRPGFINSAVFLIIFLLASLISYAIANKLKYEFSLFLTYIPVCIFSACLIFPVAIKSNKNYRPGIKNFHTMFLTIISPIINFFLPGSGFLLIGDIKTGSKNFCGFFLSLFIILGIIKNPAFNLELKTVFLFGLVFAIIFQIISTGFIIRQVVTECKSIQVQGKK